MADATYSVLHATIKNGDYAQRCRAVDANAWLFNDRTVFHVGDEAGAARPVITDWYERIRSIVAKTSEKHFYLKWAHF